MTALVASIQQPCPPRALHPAGRGEALAEFPLGARAGRGIVVVDRPMILAGRRGPRSRRLRRARSVEP